MYKERTVKENITYQKLTRKSPHQALTTQNNIHANQQFKLHQSFLETHPFTPTHKQSNIILIPTFAMINRLTLVVPLLISTKFLVLKPDLIQKDQFTRN